MSFDSKHIIIYYLRSYLYTGVCLILQIATFKQQCMNSDDRMGDKRTARLIPRNIISINAMLINTILLFKLI